MNALVSFPRPLDLTTNYMRKMSNEKKMVVRWEPSSEGGSEAFSLEDLGVESVEEWDDLRHDEQDQRIREALDCLSERVWAVPVRWNW